MAGFYKEDGSLDIEAIDRMASLTDDDIASAVGERQVVQGSDDAGDGQPFTPVNIGSQMLEGVDIAPDKRTPREKVNDLLKDLDYSKFVETREGKCGQARALLDKSMELLGWGKVNANGRGLFGEAQGDITELQTLKHLADWARTGKAEYLMNNEQMQFMHAVGEGDMSGDYSMADKMVKEGMKSIWTEGEDLRGIDKMLDEVASELPAEQQAVHQYRRQVEQLKKTDGIDGVDATAYIEKLPKNFTPEAEAAYDKGLAGLRTEATNRWNAKRRKEYWGKISTDNTLQALESMGESLSYQSRLFVARMSQTGEFDKRAYMSLPPEERDHALALVKISRGSLQRGYGFIPLVDRDGNTIDVTRDIYGAAASITDIGLHVGNTLQDFQGLADAEQGHRLGNVAEGGAIAHIVGAGAKYLWRKAFGESEESKAARERINRENDLNVRVRTALTQGIPEADSFIGRSVAGFTDNIGFLMIGEVGSLGKLVAARGSLYAARAARIAKAEEMLKAAQLSGDAAAIETASATLKAAQAAGKPSVFFKTFEELGAAKGKAEAEVAAHVVKLENVGKGGGNAAEAARNYLEAQAGVGKAKSEYEAAAKAYKLAVKTNTDVAGAAERLQTASGRYASYLMRSNPSVELEAAIGEANFFDDMTKSMKAAKDYAKSVEAAGKSAEIGAKALEYTGWYAPFYSQHIERSVANGIPFEIAATRSFWTMLWSGTWEKAAFTAASKIGIPETTAARQSLETIGAIVRREFAKVANDSLVKKVGASAVEGGKILLERELTNLAHGVDSAFNVTAQSVMDEMGVMLGEIYDRAALNYEKGVVRVDENGNPVKDFSGRQIVDAFAKKDFVKAFMPDEKWAETCVNVLKESAYPAIGFTAASGPMARLAHRRMNRVQQNSIRQTIGDEAYSNYQLKNGGLTQAYDDFERVRNATTDFIANDILESVGKMDERISAAKAAGDSPETIKAMEDERDKRLENSGGEVKTRYSDIIGAVLQMTQDAHQEMSVESVMDRTGVDQNTAELLVSMANDFAALEVRQDFRDMRDNLLAGRVIGADGSMQDASPLDFRRNLVVRNAEFAFSQFAKYSTNVKDFKEIGEGVTEATVDLGNGREVRVGFAKNQTVTSDLLMGSISSNGEVASLWRSRHPGQAWDALTTAEKCDFAASVIEGNNRSGGAFYYYDKDGNRESIPVKDLITLTDMTTTRAVSHEVSHTIYRAAEALGFIDADTKAGLAEALGIDRTVDGWEVQVDEAVAEGYADYTNGNAMPALPRLKTSYDTVNKVGNFILDAVFGGASAPAISFNTGRATASKHGLVSDFYEAMLRGDLESLKDIGSAFLQGGTTDARAVRDRALEKVQAARQALNEAPEGKAKDDARQALRAAQEELHKANADWDRQRRERYERGGSGRYSIVGEFDDGTKFVEVTDIPEDIRSASNIKKKAELVEGLLKKRWMNTILDKDGVGAFFNGHSAHEYANPAKPLPDEILNTKFNSANELEAIVATSTNPRIVPDGLDGHKHDNVKEWEHRDVIFRVDGRFYSGRVNIQILEKVGGRAGNFRKFHDVTKIKDITDGVNDLHGQIKDQSYPSAVGETEDSIAQSSTTRNSRNSLVTPARDAAYLDAVNRGDMKEAARMVREAAEKAGYVKDSSYQGTSAFNGAAPSANGYFATKEERKAAWESGEMDDTQTLGDFVFDGIDLMNFNFILLDDRYRRNARPEVREAVENLRMAVAAKSKTVVMYRSVPSSVKEDSFRNGDWITPSRSYAVENARIHGWGEEYRIIEQEVSVEDIWWDGNDIAEWGYDDGSEYAYRNTGNNRKLLSPVTYDDAGNIIPLSRRFNERKADARYSLGSENTGFEWDDPRGWNVSVSVNSYAKARDVLNGLKNKPLLSADGLPATITGNTRDKIVSGKSVRKSTSLAVHFAAIENIESLYSRAKEYFSEDGDKPNVKTMHRLVAPFVITEGDHAGTYIAKISVKEYVDKTSNKLYTIEALDIENPDGILASVNPENREGRPHRESLSGIVSHLMKKSQSRYAQVRTPEFKAWFGDWENDPANSSKVVDENGEPMVVYRGASFDPLATEPGKGVVRPESYFTSDPEYAKRYGKVNAYYLRIKKPLDIRNTEDAARLREFYPKGYQFAVGRNGALDWGEMANFDLDELREKYPVYDGIILDEGGDPQVDGSVKDRGLSYVPFDGAAQVKSATENTGAFDANNPDVRYSMVGRYGAASLGIGGFDDAKRMEADGVDRYDIWRKTGWWRGKDGKWRVEVDPPYLADRSKFNFLKDGELVRLGELFPDSNVIKAYGLERIPVITDFDGERQVLNGATAAYGFRINGETGIIINPGLVEHADTNPNTSQLRLLSNFSPEYAAYSREWHRLFNEYDKLGMEKAEELEKKAVAVFRATEASKVYDDIRSENGRLFIPSERFLSVMTHEIQHVIQDREGFAKGGNPGLYGKEPSTAEIDERISRLNAELDKVAMAGEDEAAFNRLRMQIKEAEAERLKIRNASRDEAILQYHLLSGEVEARNVEKRLNMPLEKRISTPPWETEDVNADKQTVRFSLASTETPEFKAWFGKSKMVDEKGLPRVFYHGTNWDALNAPKGKAVFSDSRRGTGSGDNGFFGRGHYFAYTIGEASYYGHNVIPVFLRIENPFDFQKELDTLWGKRTATGFAGRLAPAVNLAQKFPDIAKEYTATYRGEYSEEYGGYELKEINLVDFAKEAERVHREIKFEVVKIEGSDEVIVRAEPHKEKDGEVEWTEYTYDERFFGEDAANDELLRVYDYLEKVSFPELELPNITDVMQDQEMTDAIKAKGHDGVIQSEDGDEAVVFDPNQVKSATANKGDFSRSDNDIRYSLAERLDAERLKIEEEGGRLLLAHHGTDRRGFTEFVDTDSIGYFFAKTKRTAGSYIRNGSRYDLENPGIPSIGEVETYLNDEASGYTEEEVAQMSYREKIDAYLDGTGDSSGIYDVALKMKDPYEIDCRGANWDAIYDVSDNDDRTTYDLVAVKYDSYEETFELRTRMFGEDNEKVETFDSFDGLKAAFGNMFGEEFGVDLDEIKSAASTGEDHDAVIVDGRPERGSMCAVFTFDSASGEGWYTEAKRTRDIVDDAKQMGCDGVILHNVIDNGGGVTEAYIDDVYVVMNPAQVKLVDDMTYDDDGSIIPADKRLDWENPDMRFSLAKDIHDVLETNGDGHYIVSGGKAVHFGNKVPILEFLGIRVDDVFTVANRIRKIVRKHDLTEDQVARLFAPDTVPVAVFVDVDGKGSIAIVTDMIAKANDGKDKPVMIFLTRSTDNANAFMASAYSRSDAGEQAYVSWKNKLAYVDENKITNLGLKGETDSQLKPSKAGDVVKTSEDFASWSTSQSISQSSSEGQGGSSKSRFSLAIPPNLKEAFTTEDLLTMAAAGRLAKNSLGEEAVKADVARRYRQLRPEATDADIDAIMSRAKGDATAVTNGFVSKADAEIMNRLTSRQLDRYLASLKKSGRSGIRTGVGAERARQRLDDIAAQKIADSIAAQTGISINELEATLGVDLAETLVRLETIFDAPEKAGTKTEEGESSDAGEMSSETDPIPLSPEEQAQREAAIRQLCHDIMAKAYLADAKWQAKKAERKAKRDAKRKAEAEAEGVEIDGESDESPASAEDIASYIASRQAVNLKNPNQFAQFVAILCAEKWRKDHGIADGVYVWKDPVALQHLRLTAQGVYDSLAKKLMYSRRRESAFNAIADLENAPTFAAVIGQMEYCGKVIASGMVIERADELIKDIDQILKQKFGASGRFQQNVEDTERKVSGLTELWARDVRKVLRWSEEKCADELQKVIDRLAGVEAEYKYNNRDPNSSKQFNKDLRMVEVIHAFGGLVHRSLGEITDARVKILDRLENDTVADRAEWRQRQVEDAAAMIKAAVEKGEAFSYDDRRGSAAGKVGRAVSEYFAEHLDFKHVLLDLARFCKSESDAAAFSEWVDNLQHRIQLNWDRAKTEQRKKAVEFRQALEKIYGASYAKVMKSLMDHDERFDKFGDMTIREGENERKVRVRMSKAQAMNLYVAMQQKGYLDNVTRNGRQGQSAELRQLFDKEDLEMIKWLGEWYDRNRAEVSAVSERLFGLPVEAEEANYFPVSPLRPKHGLNETSSETWSPFPAALTARVRHGLDFDVRTDIFTVWTERMAEQAQWKNMAELGVELRDVFARPDVQMAITNSHGQKAMDRVKAFINDILRGQVQLKGRNAAVDYVRGWTALSALGGNLGVMLKQTTSIPAFAFEIGVGNLTKHLTTAFTPSGIEAMRAIWNSEQRKNRWDSGNSEEVTNALNGSNPSLLKRLMQKSMVFNKVGDAVPALVVGQGIYRAYLAQGCTAEEAMNRTWEIVNRTQQTGQMDNLTGFQRRSSLGRFITQFQTTVRQYTAYEISAIRNLLAKPMSGKNWTDFARTTALNGVLASMYYLGGVVWQYILGRKPDEETVYGWVESMLTGPWSSLFFLGSFAQLAAETLVEGDSRQSATVPSMALAGTVVKDILKSGHIGASLLGEAFGWGASDYTLEDLLKSADHGMRAFSSPYRDFSKAYHNYVLGEGDNKKSQQKKRKPRKKSKALKPTGRRL